MGNSDIEIQGFLRHGDMSSSVNGYDMGPYIMVLIATRVRI